MANVSTSTPTSTPAPESTGLAGKGLKIGALGLVASVVIGIASTAPAYSLAAALGYVADSAGTKAPLIMLLAFIPILFV
jgi:hypothetical protein